METIVMQVKGSPIDLRPEKNATCGICGITLKNKAYKMVLEGTMYAFHKITKHGTEETFIKLKWIYVCPSCAKDVKRVLADLSASKRR